MDSDAECRAIAFDEKYRDIFGCYPDEEIYEDEDGNPLSDYDIRSIERERTQMVRRALGWR